MAKEVNQKLKQELNEDGELVKLWGKGDYKIPVRIDLDAMKENGFLSGVTKETLHKKRVCNRTEQVVYVRGSKEMYDFVMTSYSNEYKAEDRDRRCLIDNGKGKLIRCPERVKNSITGKMESNSCQKCVYYNSLDKKNFYTATFSDLASRGDEDDLEEFEPGTVRTMGEGERYYRILNDLIAFLTERDTVLAEIIRLKGEEDNLSQKEIGKRVGLDQRRVSEALKNFRPEFEKFLMNLSY